MTRNSQIKPRISTIFFFHICWNSVLDECHWRSLGHQFIRITKIFWDKCKKNVRFVWTSPKFRLGKVRTSLIEHRSDLLNRVKLKKRLECLFYRKAWAPKVISNSFFILWDFRQLFIISVANTVKTCFLFHIQSSHCT